jgi:hypothetical protein
MTVGDILDYTFRTYRNNFKRILIFSALISGLFSLLLLILTKAAAPRGMITDPWSMIINGLKSGNWENYLDSYMYNTPEAYMGSDFFLRSMLVMLISYGGTFLTSVFVTPFAQGGITNIASRYFHGFKLNARLSLMETKRQYGKLIVTGLSIMVCYMGMSMVFGVLLMVIMIPITIAASFAASSSSPPVFVIVLLVIFGLVVAAVAIAFVSLISFIYPVAVTEGKYHFNAVGRSFKLAFKKFWRVLGVNLLVYLLVYIVIGAISGLAFALAYLSPVNIMFQQVVTLLITALCTPILYIASTMLYFDIRMRTEGYGLELMSHNLEGNSQWGQQQY